MCEDAYFSEMQHGGNKSLEGHTITLDEDKYVSPRNGAFILMPRVEGSEVACTIVLREVKTYTEVFPAGYQINLKQLVFQGSQVSKDKNVFIEADDDRIEGVLCQRTKKLKGPFRLHDYDMRPLTEVRSERRGRLSAISVADLNDSLRANGLQTSFGESEKCDGPVRVEDIERISKLKDQMLRQPSSETSAQASNRLIAVAEEASAVNQGGKSKIKSQADSF
jgi:hypothetical protein